MLMAAIGILAIGLAAQALLVARIIKQQQQRLDTLYGVVNEMLNIKHRYFREMYVEVSAARMGQSREEFLKAEERAARLVQRILKAK